MTSPMKRFMDSLARQYGVEPPHGYTTSGAVHRAFLDQHTPKKEAGRPDFRVSTSGQMQLA